MNPNEYDSTITIIMKLVIIVLTLFISGYGAIREGIKILRRRYRKTPTMGFSKRD